MSALKQAVAIYAHGSPSFLTGVMNGIQEDIVRVREKLISVETDSHGRDGNGIDIEAALLELKHMEANKEARRLRR